MELTREQIEEALEHCRLGNPSACQSCPMLGVELADQELCSERLAGYSLAVIQELKEEIKKLK